METFLLSLWFRDGNDNVKYLDACYVDSDNSFNAAEIAAEDWGLAPDVWKSTPENNGVTTFIIRCENGRY
jgi:hypothetical protein